MWYYKNLYFKSPEAKDYMSMFRIKSNNLNLSNYFEQNYNCANVYKLMSARSAIYFLLKSLNFKPHSEVIVCGFTCEVVPAAVIYAGLIPKYIDISIQTLSIDKEIFFKTDFSNVKAIILQHTFGISVIDEEIIKFCRIHDIYIIEDCSLALFSEYNGKLLGSYGDASVFSFEISKAINAVRGGVLITKSNLKLNLVIKEVRLINKIQLFIQLITNYFLYNDNLYPITRYMLFILYKSKFFRKSTLDIEYNLRMPTDYLNKMPFFLEKFISSQLMRENIFKDKNKFIYNFYINNISSKFQIPTGVYHSNFLVRFPIFVANKFELIQIFKLNGYELGSWFNSPLSSINLNYNFFNLNLENVKNSNKVSDYIINLPMHSKLQLYDLNKIILLLNKHGKYVKFEN